MTAARALARTKRRESELKLRADQTFGSNDETPDLIHHQVQIRWGRRTAWVDEGVAPLIEWLWRNGIDTCGSCENAHEWQPDTFPPGRVAWVAFLSADHRRMRALFGLEPPPPGPEVIATAEFFRLEDDGFTLVDITADKT